MQIYKSFAFTDVDALKTIVELSLSLFHSLINRDRRQITRPPPHNNSANNNPLTPKTKSKKQKHQKNSSFHTQSLTKVYKKLPPKFILINGHVKIYCESIVDLQLWRTHFFIKMCGPMDVGLKSKRGLDQGLV